MSEPKKEVETEEDLKDLDYDPELKDSEAFLNKFFDGDASQPF